MKSSDERTIIYCRESRDDYGENYDRIEVQRDILVEFCKREGLNNIIEIILDDNVSGTKFKRLNGIVEKAKRGQVDVLVFKDASRLGRNLRESLNFIHILEECDVRVLFESETYDENFFPLLAWFNEQRAREDSQKVRRVFKHKMECGELLIKTVYGYDKIKNQLVINEETASVVKRIYNMFLAGYGADKIAAALNCENVPTPSQAMFDDNRAISYAWNRQHIYRILTNSVYTGDMIYSRVEKKSFKSSKVIRKPPEDWIVIPNRHDAIVSKEDFDKVQKLRARGNKRRSATTAPKLFSGLIVCGRCGAGLVQRVRKARKDAYICGKYSREGCIKDDIRPNYGCNTHHVTEEELEQLTIQYCKSIIEGDNDFIFRVLNKSARKDEKQNDEQKISSLKKDIDKYERIIEKIYDDKLNGVSSIPDTILDKKLKEYTQKIDGIHNVLREMELTYTDEMQINIDELRRAMESLLKKGLNNRILKICFDKIMYFMPGEITDSAIAQHNLPEDAFAYLQTNGGFLFWLNTF